MKVPGIVVRQPPRASWAPGALTVRWEVEREGGVQRRGSGNLKLKEATAGTHGWPPAQWGQVCHVFILRGTHRGGRAERLSWGRQLMAERGECRRLGLPGWAEGWLLGAGRSPGRRL